MPIFYYPTKAGATTTLTLTGAQALPDTRITESYRTRTLTAGGAVISQSHYHAEAPKIDYIVLSLQRITHTEKNNLDSFIWTTVNGSQKTFDFDDEEGTVFSSVRYWQDDNVLSVIASDLAESDTILLRIERASGYKYDSSLKYDSTRLFNGAP